MALRTLALILCALLLACAREARRPNLILILSDDLRWDAMSCAGNTVIDTPGFDRLAREGARFANAFVTTSLCCPSRATIFSGLSAEQHGVQDIFAPLADSVSIFPDRLRAAGYETAHIGKWHLNRYAQRDPAFERWISFVAWVSYRDPELIVEDSLLRYPGHLTDVLTDLAVHFVRQEHERPFFLVLSHLAPHTPYEPQERFRGRFDAHMVPLPESVGRPPRDGVPWLDCRQADGDWAQLHRQYYEMVAGVDESVSRLLEALEERKLLDDTLIVLLGDNGYHLGEHGLGDKRTAYEESMRIPLLLRYPKWFRPGTLVEGELALNADLAPTFLEAAGLSPDARGLRGLAAGEWSRDRFIYRYWQSPSEDSVARCTPELRALRTRDHKLIHSLLAGGERFEELYDLRDDPLELRNLSPRASELDSLRRLLDPGP